MRGTPRYGTTLATGYNCRDTNGRGRETGPNNPTLELVRLLTPILKSRGYVFVPIVEVPQVRNRLELQFRPRPPTLNRECKKRRDYFVCADLGPPVSVTLGRISTNSMITPSGSRQ